MAQGAVTIAVEANFGRDDGQGRRLALGTDHEYTSETKASENAAHKTGR
jgi:hypothetical protein